MPKVQKVPRIAGVTALIVAVIVTAGLVAVVRHGPRGPRARPAPIPAGVAGPAAEPYAPRPGPNGTKILTEAIDPLSLAVPGDWKAPAPDALSLPAELDTLGMQAPSLKPVLQTESQFAAKGSVRLFAYRPEAPFAFVSVLSYSSPGAGAITPELVAAAVAASKKKPSGVAVSGGPSAVGEVLKLDSSPVIHKQHLVVELVDFVASGRTVLVLMVSEVNGPGIPPLFGQIADSLRRG